MNGHDVLLALLIAFLVFLVLKLIYDDEEQFNPLSSGLLNDGNTCYAASAVQLLLTSSVFLDNLKRSSGQLAGQLKQLLSASGQPASCRSIITSVNKAKNKGMKNSQEDCG